MSCQFYRSNFARNIGGLSISSIS